VRNKFGTLRTFLDEWPDVFYTRNGFLNLKSDEDKSQDDLYLDPTNFEEGGDGDGSRDTLPPRYRSGYRVLGGGGGGYGGTYSSDQVGQEDRDDVDVYRRKVPPYVGTLGKRDTQRDLQRDLQTDTDLGLVARDTKDRDVDVSDVDTLRRKDPRWTLVKRSDIQLGSEEGRGGGGGGRETEREGGWAGEEEEESEVSESSQEQELAAMIHPSVVPDLKVQRPSKVLFLVLYIVNVLGR
jgi:hypothetical protein